MDFDASIDDLKRQAVHARKAVQDIICNRSVALVGRLQKFFQRVAATFSSFVDEAPRNAATSLHGDDAHCQLTLRSEQMANQGCA